MYLFLIAGASILCNIYKNLKIFPFIGKKQPVVDILEKEQYNIKIKSRIFRETRTMIPTKAACFLEGLKGKRVAICGIGKNNTPVVRQFLQYGATVIACDRRSREELGDIAGELENAGATLCLGEHYLDEVTAVDLVLRTPGMKPYLPPFEAARAKGIPVTSEMELFFDLCPAPIYAVTGSDGKTTTTTIIAGLLKAAGKTVHLGGNIGKPLLPEILSVKDSDVAVVELSSFQLTKMHKRPAVAVVTNIAPNHLDWHTDMDEYVTAKYNLLADQHPEDRTVLNADNDYTRAFAAKAPGEVYLFSRRTRPARGAYLRADGMLCVCRDGEETPVMAAGEIRLPGVHNAENYLAALCAVWDAVPPETFREYARTFSGVPHRCELCRTVGGVRYYNDSIGSSPSRTIAGLRAFDRKVILLAGGKDKNVPYTPLGEAAKDTVKLAILMGPTADKIEAAIRAYSDLPIRRVSGMEEAVQTAQALAEPGDIVFLSPASTSFDRYRNFEERGDHFRREVAKLKEERV